MSSWTVPKYPWTRKSFQNKSVTCLRWICREKKIDIIDGGVYKNVVKPYQKALVKWYQTEYLEAGSNSSEQKENSNHNIRTFKYIYLFVNHVHDNPCTHF